MIHFDRSTQTFPADLSILAGSRPSAPFLIRRAEDEDQLSGYHRLRREAFVDEQGLFIGSDHDDTDDDPRTVVLVATDPAGTVVGGVRLAPVGSVDLGWWTGSRLVTSADARTAGIGPALIRAACAYVESAGVLRFEATV